MPTTIFARTAFLLGSAAAAMAAGLGLSAQTTLWTSELPSNDYDVDPAQRTLRPVAIVAARNGTFSGKVVVENPTAVTGVKTEMSPFKGPGTIPPANVQVRFAVEWEKSGKYAPTGPDTLLEAPPADAKPMRRGSAVLPVWVTVKVPRDAKPGQYAGELTVHADGLGAKKVPVNLEIGEWVLPDPQDYRTWSDVVQSPDTLAMEYDAPLWSDRHWDLIARSFRLISDTGSRTLYVPLIARTNVGNEESMVRWISKGNKYEYDFSVMDKYLDTAEQHLGKPTLVIFWSWDICMSQKSLQRGLRSDKQGGSATRQNREDLLGKGPRVTTVDASGKTDLLILPRYVEPAGKAAWKPLWAEIRKRMAKRGLEEAMLLGMVSDLQPDKDDAEALKEITGDLPWSAQCHPSLLRGKPAKGNKVVQGVADLGYVAHVYAITFQVNPAKGRLYGWQSPVLDAHYYRGGELLGHAVDIRTHPEFNITGGQRGVGRIPGEFWSAVKDNRGQRASNVCARYPENLWRNLDICTWFLAPGPDGAVMTTRLEHIREGIQECEARIFLEDALLDNAKKAKLGADLAKRAQDTLDARQLAMWKTVWMDDQDLAAIGTAATGRNPEEGLWQALAKGGKSLPGYFDGAARKMRSDHQEQGRKWWLQGWEERNRQLYNLCAEAAAKLGPAKK